MDSMSLSRLVEEFEGEVMELDVPDMSVATDWFCKVKDTGICEVLKACDSHEAERAMLVKYPESFRKGFECKPIPLTPEKEIVVDVFEWMYERLKRDFKEVKSKKHRQANGQALTTIEAFSIYHTTVGFQLNWTWYKLYVFKTLKDAVEVAKFISLSGLVRSEIEPTQEQVDAANWLMWQLIHMQLRKARKNARRRKTSNEVSASDDNSDSLQ